jgi:hypothetical protein
MSIATAWARWIKKWRIERAARAVVPPDPADCGTAWGLDLTVQRTPTVAPRPRKR